MISIPNAATKPSTTRSRQFDRRQSRSSQPAANRGWSSFWFTKCVIVTIVIASGGCDRAAQRPTGDHEPEPASNENAGLVDVTRLAGIDFVHDAFRKGEYLFPEINGAGCAFLDYDNDGWLDIYFVQSGRDLRNPTAPGKPNRLFRNRGDGTFEDVTESSQAGDTGYGQGVACGDYNNDGYMDLYVANVGGPSKLLRNTGAGQFEDVTEQAGVGNGHWAITPAFLDIDNDGYLDLFATNYVDWSVEKNVVGKTKNGQPDYPGPRSFAAMSAILYRNNGDGTFADVTRAAGIDQAFGAGMGILCADFNDDDFVDIYVANDSWANQLWINQGDGTFQDQALVSGCALSGNGMGQASMGTNAVDLDHNGRLDLFTTNYYKQGSIIYFQDEKGNFSDDSKRNGLFRLTAAYTGFGACFLDLFNDGSPCLYIGNGAAVLGGETRAATASYAQQDLLLQWTPSTRRFVDLSAQIGLTNLPALTSRGVAVGDYDNDGAVDVLLSNNNGPARLLRNTTTRGNHWLMVRCLDVNGRRDAIGAKVFVTSGGTTTRRDVIINYSYASACDPRLHFGLGAHKTADRVVVRWPGGAESVWENVAANQVLVAVPKR